MSKIRKAALAACITAVLSILLLVRSSVFQFNSLLSTYPQAKIWLIPVLVVLFSFTITMPAFYFALYRNQEMFAVSKRLQALALATAIVFGLTVASRIPTVFASFAAYFSHVRILATVTGSFETVIREPQLLNQFAGLVGMLANLSYVLLLLALSSLKDEAPRNAGVSRQLKTTAKITTIAWGIFVGLLVIRLAATPFGYYATRDYALKIGRTPPPLLPMLTASFHLLLTQACLFVIPYIVYRSCSTMSLSPEERTDLPPEANSI